MATRPSVLIIGAGVSGLAAYATLRTYDGLAPFDLILLEAEGRTGGRVCSVPFGGSVVDIGGQWVHGEIGNLVYEMVKDLDLLSDSFNTYEDVTFYVSDGRVLEKEVTDELFGIGGRIMGDAEGARKVDGTFGEYFVNRFNEEVSSARPEVHELSDLVLQWFNKFYLCMDPAKSWHDVPTVGPFIFRKIEGNQQLNWRDKGYGTVLDVLLKKIPDPSNRLPIEQSLHLNKEVTRISWDSPSSKVHVTCSDGSAYSADHCLITVSLGVLQSTHKTLFDPPLPPFKTDAITNLNIGVANKILLRFSEKWWPDDLKGFSLCWTQKDRLRLKNEVPHFEPSYEGRSWVEDIFGFYVIDSHPRVLLGWITGQLAAEVEKLTDEVVVENCVFLLRKFVGNKYEVPQPEAVLRSKWKSNPHFNGAYSYYGVSQHSKGVATEDLIRPVKSSSGKEVLLFAGEATHPTRYSTVDGAIETGYREAERLIEMYK